MATVLPDPTLGGQLFDFDKYRISGDKYKKGQEIDLGILRALGPQLINILTQNIPGALEKLQSVSPQVRNALAMQIMQGIRQLNSSGDTNQLANRAAQFAQNQGTQAAFTQLATNPGLSDALRQGMMYDTTNNANQAGNNAYIQMNDPLQATQRKNALTQQIGSNWQSLGQDPSLNIFDHLAQLVGPTTSGVMGRPIEKKDDMFGSILGSAVGAWAGGGFA